MIIGVAVKDGCVRIEFGVYRTDHRGATPVNSSTPVARLVLPPKTSRELGELSRLAADYAVSAHAQTEVAFFGVADPSDPKVQNAPYDQHLSGWPVRITRFSKPDDSGSSA
jgi:hypothetical protein